MAAQRDVPDVFADGPVPFGTMVENDRPAVMRRPIMPGSGAFLGTRARQI